MEDKIQAARDAVIALDRFMAGMRQNWLDTKNLEMQTKVVQTAGKLGVCLFFIPTMREFDADKTPGYVEWYKKRFPWTKDPDWRIKYHLGADFDFSKDKWSIDEIEEPQPLFPEKGSRFDKGYSK